MLQTAMESGIRLIGDVQFGRDRQIGKQHGRCAGTRRLLVEKRSGAFFVSRLSSDAAIRTAAGGDVINAASMSACGRSYCRALHKHDHAHQQKGQEPIH